MDIELDRDENWGEQNNIEEAEMYVYSKENLLEMIKVLPLKDIEWLVKNLEKHG